MHAPPSWSGPIFRAVGWSTITMAEKQKQSAVSLLSRNLGATTAVKSNQVGAVLGIPDEIPGRQLEHPLLHGSGTGQALAGHEVGRKSGDVR